MRKEFFKNFYEFKKKCYYSFVTSNIKKLSLSKYIGDKETNFYESEPLSRIIYIYHYEFSDDLITFESLENVFSYFYFKIPLIGKNMLKDKDKIPDVIFEFDQ
jgi:hypothetical protein